MLWVATIRRIDSGLLQILKSFDKIITKKKMILIAKQKNHRKGFEMQKAVIFKTYVVDTLDPGWPAGLQCTTFLKATCVHKMIHLCKAYEHHKTS